MKDECYEFIKNEIGKTNIVGFGSYGQVKIARNTQSGQVVAIKLIHGKNSKQQIDVHHKLNHPNIIKLLNYYYEKENNITYMVLEYAENGTLNEKIKFSLGQMSKQLIRKYFKDICEAIRYLHNHNYMHRDIKPENILITKDNSAKLCDFGFAAIFQARTTICGTFEYMAPQMIKKKHYNYKIDIWALGILLFEMIQGIAPFRGQTGEQVIAEMKKPIRFSSRFDSLQIQLIKKILRVNAQNRPTAQQILDHPYFKPLKQDDKTNLARNTVEIHSKSPKAEKTYSHFMKQKLNSSKQQMTKILKNSNQKISQKLQSPFQTKNRSPLGYNYFKAQPNLNQNYTNNNFSQSFKTKNNQVSETLNKKQEYKRFNHNPFGAQSPQGQKKTKSPANIKTEAKNEPPNLDHSTRTQKKTSINTNLFRNTKLFGNTQNSSVKTLSILNKSKLNDPEGVNISISGKNGEKPQINQNNAGQMQYFNKSFTNVKAHEAVSDPVLRGSNPVVMDLKQEQLTFGVVSGSKKTLTTNSSVNVPFKYSKTNFSQEQSSNTSMSSYQQNYFQAQKRGREETGFSYIQIYNLQKTANNAMNAPKVSNLTKLKESFK